MPQEFEGRIRLREFVKGLFPYLETGSAVKKAIQKNQIRVGNQIGYTGDWVSAGSEINYECAYEVIEADRGDVEIFYEDDDLLIVRKPPGISSGGRPKSLQWQLQGISIEDKEGSLPFPYLVHRLDKATEGIMIAAKNIAVRRLLAEMIASHSIIKKYVLIAEGIIPESLRWITTEIDTKPAKTEILQTIVLNTKNPTSKVFVRIYTGRTHQIRKHFNQIGHPIVGDNLYNKGGLTFGSGLLLCAHYLKLINPITQKSIKIEYPIPLKIDKYRPM